jgi:hypothetical protein
MKSSDRQVFWLSASRLPVAFPDLVSSGVSGYFRGVMRTLNENSTESLADYSGGPATDLHRFPYCPRPQAEAPVECYLL